MTGIGVECVLDLFRGGLPAPGVDQRLSLEPAGVSVDVFSERGPCAGAVTVLHDPEPITDPFVRPFRGTLVRLECFAEVPAPFGPVVERYAGAPRPAEGLSP